MKVLTGVDHTVCLDNENNIRATGSNSQYQLGYDKKNQNTTIFSQIAILPKIIDIGCGCHFTLCVDQNGFIWAFGENYSGSLGFGDNRIYDIPKQIPNIPPIKKVYCGAFHSIVLDNENKIWGFGKNEEGQLGLGHKRNVFSPTKLQKIPENITHFSLGAYFSICLDKNGESYACGRTNLFCDDYFRKISEISNIIDICSGEGHTLFLNRDHELFFMGELTLEKEINIPTKLELPLIQNIFCTSAGSLCVDDQRNVWVFGINYDGELGVSDEIIEFPTLIQDIKNVDRISSGFGGHTLIKTNEEIFLFGSNEFGQLGSKIHYGEKNLKRVKLKEKYFNIF